MKQGEGRREGSKTCCCHSGNLLLLTSEIGITVSRLAPLPAPINSDDLCREELDIGKALINVKHCLDLNKLWLFP